MLNPFPIQFLAMLAYLILRVTIAGILIYLGISHLKHRHELKEVFTLSWFPYGTTTAWTFALLEIILGLFIFSGAHTQYAVLVVLIMSCKMLLMRHWFNHPTIPPKIFYVLLLGASLTLFITGAGALAFDLPI